MKNSLRAFGIVVCLAMMPAFPQAQPYVKYGSGFSTSYSFFDPKNPIQAPRLPVPVNSAPIVVPRGSPIPVLDYLRIQSQVPPRAPAAPPQLVSSSPVPSRQPVLADPSISFEGIQQTIYTPPSTNIAAGPSDLLQIVNSTVARYDKTGKLTEAVDLTTWFSAQYRLVCSSGITCIFGDVTIRYDQMQGRFLLTLQAFDQFAATSYYLMSISNGATYASGWKNWALNARFDGTTLTTNWADFPQIGFDNDAVYLSANMFNLANSVFQYAKVRIFKKSELYNPNVGILTYKDLYDLRNEDGTPASTLQAPHLRGKARGSASSVGYLINTGDFPNSNFITLWKINEPTSNAPTTTRVTMKNAWPYSYPTGAPQFGSTIPLETGPASYGKVIMRDGLLFGARNTGYTDAPSTVTYDVIDPVHNLLVLQYRWINGNFFYPAFDIPASNGPGTNLPNNLIVGTTTGVNGLTYAGVTNVKAGEGAYDFSTNGVTARWGDYNGAQVDPVLGGMWVSGEYAKPKANNASVYGTWNMYFPMTTTPMFGDVPSTNANFNFINTMKLWNITKGCNDGTVYCFLDAGTRESIAVFVIRALYGEDFQYPQAPYFTDIPATFSSFKYIQKFREQGFTKGCGDGTKFCPADPATREAAAIFLIRAKMRNLFPADDFPYPQTAFFTDVPSTHPSFSYIQKFREMGITLGCSATEFCPTATLTREQLAVFIVRAFLN